jgi:hypothetical protein
MAESVECWETDATTLRVIAARRLAEGDLASATLLHDLAVHFEAWAQQPTNATAPDQPGIGPAGGISSQSCTP